MFRNLTVIQGSTETYGLNSYQISFVQHERTSNDDSKHFLFTNFEIRVKAGTSGRADCMTPTGQRLTLCEFTVTGLSGRKRTTNLYCI